MSTSLSPPPQQPSTTGPVELIVRAVVAAALLARLAGIRWLPPAGATGLLLVALTLLPAVRRRVAADRGWRGVLDTIRQRRFAIALLGLAGLSLLVRLTAVGADLGHHPPDIDEFRLANNVKHFFVTGEVLHSTVEHYPGLVFWMLTGASLVAYLHGLMAGAFTSVRAMPVEELILAGRVANAFVAAGTVSFTGVIGRRLGGSAAGLLAAALVAVVPLAIQTTTQIRNDPGQVLLVLAAVWSSLALHDSGRWRWGVAAGACAGLATGVKYTSAFALVPPMVAACTAPRGDRARHAGWIALAFAVALAASNHFLWLDFPNFVRQLSDQIGITGTTHWAATDNPAAFHAFVLARFGPGLILLVLAGAWGAIVLARGRADAWLFWTFPLLYSWFTTTRPAQLPRWVYPLLPFVSIAGTCGLALALAAMRRWPPLASRRTIRLAVGAALIALAFATPFRASLITYSGRLTPSTTGVLEAWLRQTIPRHDAVLLEDGWLDLRGAAFAVVRVPDLGRIRPDSYALSAADWVVVPETRFASPALRRLTLAKHVEAEPRSLGGHMGYDYRVYASPRLSPVTAFEARLDAPASVRVLGAEWPENDSGQGRQLPRGGATLYVPPLAADRVAIAIDLANAGGPPDPVPVTVEIAGRPVPLVDTPGEEGLRRLSGTIGLAASPRAVVIRLEPVERTNRIRVVRMRLE